MLHCTDWTESEGLIRIETDALKAAVRTRGYVSGVMRGSLLDRATGAVDPGFGLHVMDFLLAPGRREHDDGFSARPYHGDLPKHIVEGPQVCTRAQALDYEIVRGATHVAVRLWFTFTDAGEGYVPGSRWEQTLLFLPGSRYFLSAETITVANALPELRYRIDMPGHIAHRSGDTFREVYLSYHGRIPSSEFLEDFPPDARFLYRRSAGAIPERFIRACRLVLPDGRDGPWLAGMTLDPAAPCEAWCHQRGYVCFIQENHGSPTRAGDRIGAAYAVGYFDSVEEMQEVYDRLTGARGLAVDEAGYRLTPQV